MHYIDEIRRLDTAKTSTMQFFKIFTSFVYNAPLKRICNVHIHLYTFILLLTGSYVQIVKQNHKIY